MELWEIQHITVALTLSLSVTEAYIRFDKVAALHTLVMNDPADL